MAGPGGGVWIVFVGEKGGVSGGVHESGPFLFVLFLYFPKGIPFFLSESAGGVEIVWFRFGCGGVFRGLDKFFV